MKKITILISFTLFFNLLNSQTISEFSTGYNVISGIAITPENEVFIAEYNSHLIYKLDSAGNKTLFTTIDSGSYINDMDFDINGNLYCADPNGKVLRIDALGVVSTYAYFNGLYPSDLVIKNGEIFNAVGGGSTGYIYKLTSDINYVLIAEILNSTGITIDKNGNLYVANLTNHSLDLVTQTGAVTSLLTNIGNPRDVVIAPDGMVYVTTYNDARTSNKIIKYDPTTNTASDFVTTNLDEPWQLAIDRLGNMYVTNRGTESVVRIYDDSLLPNPNIVYIPDVNFKSRLVNNSQINTNGDSEIQVSEAANYTGQIYLYGATDVQDLTGIKAFTSVTSINAISSGLTGAIDVSSLTNLETLKFANTQATSLDATNCSSLEILECFQNNLTSINISGCTSLLQLRCTSNNLVNLDTSTNTQLTKLECGQNNITSLDLTQNINLTILDCKTNDLSSINISNNTLLTKFICLQNDITSLDVSQNINLEELDTRLNKIASLDLTLNPNLTSVRGGSYLLQNLDLRNNNNSIITSFDFENATTLSCIYVDDASYSTTNWTNIHANSSFVETEEECSTLSTDSFQIADFKIYPNPVSSILNINSPYKEATIYTIQGKELFKTNSQNINVEKLPKGLYLIQLKGENNHVFTSKFIKE